MYLSLPKVFIPAATEIEALRSGNQLYQCYERIFRRVFKLYSHPYRTSKDDLLIPRAPNGMEREQMISETIRPLLNEFKDYGKPDLLIDCYSSAPVGGPAHTYKLAKQNDLTTILPFALNGQAGTEFVQGLLFLKNMEPGAPNNALLSATQMIIPPDSRQNPVGFPFGDGTASMIVTKTFCPKFSCFEILGAGIKQYANHYQESMPELLNEVLGDAKLKNRDLQWSIVHNQDDSILKIVKDILPHSNCFNRQQYPHVNFGPADPFITLHYLYYDCASPLTGAGLIWFMGRFKTLGLVVLRRLDEA